MEKNKGNEMEKLQNYCGAIYFMILRGGIVCGRGIYVCGKRRFCSRRNYGNISIAESCFRDSGRNTYSFYKSAPYRDQLSYTGKRFL